MHSYKYDCVNKDKRSFIHSYDRQLIFHNLDRRVKIYKISKNNIVSSKGDLYNAILQL